MLNCFMAAKRKKGKCLLSGVTVAKENENGNINIKFSQLLPNIIKSLNVILSQKIQIIPAFL